MSLSLIGIMAVQIYWIVNSIEVKEKQFSFAVKQTLVSVANDLENEEVDRYYTAVENLADSLGTKPQLSTIRSFLIRLYDENSDVLTTYSSSILAENYKLNPQLMDIELDSITFTKLFNKEEITKERFSSVEGQPLDLKDTYETLSQLDDLNKRKFAQAISSISSTLPITKRVSVEQVESLLKKELRKRQIDSDFEFALYQDGYPTRIQSGDFDLKAEANWSYPLFSDNETGQGSYDLFINLPGRKKFILSSIWGMTLLSFVFTAVIVIAYSSAISQLFKQRQISQIKTDFINNMTHEFKTPIATINLALDSLKNDKISSDPEKVSNYLRMIREENKRMHSQVENVLRISKLNKRDLDIDKESTDLIDVLEDSISHVWLILEQRKGILNTHFGSLRNTILAHESHLSNVFVNILENAIKYTDESEAPVIDVYTENYRDKVVIKITDKGVGMSKAAQKKIFQKFFREHTGDIHNVKGHGLGLAYAKKIVDDHQGSISVESTKGKGSTFIIILPLIN